MSLIGTEITEGRIDFRVPSLSEACETYYKIIGQLKPGVPPLVALHGGPGCSSEYLEILSDITQHRSNDGQPRDQAALVLYDQIGAGQSTHLPEKAGDTAFWTIQLFLAELRNLLEQLGIEEYDLLGHSWGGTLAVSYAIQRPPGLRKLILYSCDPATRLVDEGRRGLISTYPKEWKEALEKYDEDGVITPEYKAAKKYYNSHHMCLIDPMPEAIVRAFQWAGRDPTVVETMYGHGYFRTTGPMKDWNVIEDLHKISAPTLVVNGAHVSLMQLYNRSWRRYRE